MLMESQMSFTHVMDTMVTQVIQVIRLLVTISGYF